MQTKPVNPGLVVSASHFLQQPNFAPKDNDQTNKEEEALPSDQKEEEEQQQELLLVLAFEILFSISIYIYKEEEEGEGDELDRHSNACRRSLQEI